MIGRPKKMVAEDILQKSMELFWERGYFQVSVRQIEKATSTNSQSIYNHFGDKEALFIASMDHYYTSIFAGLLQAVENEPDPVAAVTMAIEHFRQSAKKDRLPGCFLANAIVDMGSEQKVREIYDKGFGGLTKVITSRLSEITDRFDTESAQITAATVTNSLVGLAVAARSRPTEASIDLVFNGIIKMVDPAAGN